MSLQGKGYYIWKIDYTEKGDYHAILDKIRDADLGHVLVKIADGDEIYNYNEHRHIDMAVSLVNLLHENNVQVWGWQYVYVENPIAEARKAVQRVQQMNLKGFVVDAEKEFKEPGMDVIARRYMDELRASLPNLPIALSSYRFPSYHRQFPWKDFLALCDFNMPQVYWEEAHNPVAQLNKCIREFQTMTPSRPIIPTGAAYGTGNWKPTPDDVQDFLKAAQDLNLPAANFWSWQHARGMPRVWERIAQYPWPSQPAEKDVVEKYIEALNRHDPLELTMLYTLTGLHIDARATLQGPEKLLAWYNSFLNDILPNGTFELTGLSGTGNSRHFTWTATSAKGRVLDGNDTLGLQDGKIAYHYTFFTVST